MENMEQAGSGHGSPRSRFPSGELEVIKKGMKEMMKNMLTFQKQMLANVQAALPRQAGGHP